MKTRFWASALILFVITVNAGCKKTAVNSTGNNNAVPVPTPVGTPNGNPVTVTIGSNGGNIVSTDSAVELRFPNGALSANTQITIQPITNNAPNGLGNAYRFSPDGLKFSTPVNLVFHYTDEQIAGTISDLLGIAFQDSSGIWYGLKSFTVDTVNKTITTSIKHFSDWTFFACLKLTPQHASLRVSQSHKLDITYVSDYETADELLAPLVPKDFEDVTWVVNENVNGNSTYGTISSPSHGREGYNIQEVTYTAPSKVPSQINPVDVAAIFNGQLTFMRRTLNDIRIRSEIQIVDGDLYRIDIIGISQVPILSGQTYWDSASMTVRLSPKNSDATLIDKDSISNFPPSVTPKSADYDNCTWTWVPDQIGTINIQGGTAQLYQNGNTVQLDLRLDNTGSVSPLFNVSCGFSTNQVGGYPFDAKLAYLFTLSGPMTLWPPDFNTREVRVTLLK